LVTGLIKRANGSSAAVQIPLENTMAVIVSSNIGNFSGIPFIRTPFFVD
jgi:hypothetical protein